MSKADDARVLAELEDADGTVTATRVVDAARDIDHPFHSRFEWDDTIASEKFRQQQARTLIRSIRYVTRTDHSVVRSVRYVRSPDAEPREQRYVSVVRLRQDEDAARSALVAEFARVAALLRRAKDLSQTLGLSDQIDAVIGHVDELAVLLRMPPVEGPRAAQ